MKKGTILGLSLLSLFILSAAGPTIIANIDVSAFSFTEPLMYTKEAIDNNGDKIDDKLLSSTVFTNGFSDEIAIKFNHKIDSLDMQKLSNLGAICSNEIWDAGTRIKISATEDSLYQIAELTDVTFITTAEVRLIMVAILGSDFSDLTALLAYENSEVFWEAGCALVPYYSGAENDIKHLGVYTEIADTTDIYYTLDAIAGDDDYDFNPDTLTNANSINATQLVSDGFDGGGVKVGILDTGVRASHADLLGRVGKQQSFITTAYGYDFTDSTVEPHHYHGTHVAGIVGGDGSTVSANIGIAPGVTLYSAKIGDYTQDGSPATFASMIAGVNWLTAQGADVINLSFGTGGEPNVNILEAAIANVVKNSGIKFVTSNGNDGENGFYSTDSPTAAISVGAADDSSNPLDMAYFSSQGPNADNTMKPDLVAPGYQIVSCDYASDTGYRTLSGTSMSAPQIAGAAALLIDVCKTEGVSYNPGAIKAALMKTSDPLPSATFDYLVQGRGMANVGAAATLLINADQEGILPIIGALNPLMNPVSLYAELLQGQVVDQYITCVSPFRDDNLTLEATGDAADLLILENVTNLYSATAKVTYSIPVTTAPGTYDGEFTFKYKGTVLDTVDIEITVVPSHGEHRMLLNYRTTDWMNDHMYGQYRHFTSDLLSKGWVISEQNVVLTADILSNYEAVWFPDPFSIRWNEGITSSSTYNPLSAAESTALDNFVTAGGSVFFDFLGNAYDDENEVTYGTNVTHINEFTDNYGIHVRDDVWGSPSTIIVNPVGNHALTAGVTGVDHYGCTLETSGDAVQVTEIEAGSEYSTLAYYQATSGGRVIVMSTNFALDSDGYLNKYSGVGTQNEIFGRNLVRWATAEHRIKQYNYTFTAGTINMPYEYISGPGAEFGGYV
ncbi:MAG: S8 family peptidase, partial [Candidatus Heimdallarchaeota archaeon]